MAFPYIFEANFEQGTNGEWDSESDTGALLDFPHYSEIARQPGLPMPYHGAYCLRVVMGDTNDHTVTEGDIDIADTVTRYSAFYLCVGSDVVATADDTWNIYEVQGTASAVENAVGLRITATTDVVEIGVGNTAPTAFASETLIKNRWYHIQLVSVIQTGGTGTATLWINGVSSASVTTLTNTAVLQGVLGTQNTLSTTTGTILIDEFRFDDLQLYPDKERFPIHKTFTKSGHLFVGRGVVDAALLVSTTAGNIMRLYDTDTADVNDAESQVVELAIGASTSGGGPFTFKRGCYVQLTGTNPRGEVYIRQYGHETGAMGPLYYSEAGMRSYGLRRKARPLNV